MKGHICFVIRFNQSIMSVCGKQTRSGESRERCVWVVWVVIVLRVAGVLVTWGGWLGSTTTCQPHMNFNYNI